jgi:SWI/SNF-related matrix-associated actin-dependent regulator of chromatin subfamily A member 5
MTSKDSLVYFKGRMVWEVLVIDEAHRLKNDQSIVFSTLRDLSFVNAVLLTGTPIQNCLHELFAILNFLFPTFFTDCKLFDRIFKNSKVAREAGMLALDKLLIPLMLRREKSVVQADLPPKTETKIFVRLAPAQVEAYTSLLRAFCDSPASEKGAYLRLLCGLRKVCNHPCLLHEDENTEIDTQASGKLIVLDKLLAKLIPCGHRVLIFSQFSQVLNILADFCIRRRYLFARLDGATNRVRLSPNDPSSSSPCDPAPLPLLFPFSLTHPNIYVQMDGYIRRHHNTFSVCLVR